MRYGKECVCGRGEECKGISAAFALLKDPRRGYVALPPFTPDPIEYTDRDMNDMRKAYLRHLGVSEKSLGDSTKRRYVALHHFHPTVVQKHSQMQNAVSPIPKTLKKVDLRFLKMKLGDEDRVRDENGRKRKSYYFVPTYPLFKAKDDLKHMIRVSRLYAEAKVGSVASPGPPRKRNILPPGQSSREDRMTVINNDPSEKPRGIKTMVANLERASLSRLYVNDRRVDPESQKKIIFKKTDHEKNNKNVTNDHYRMKAPIQIGNYDRVEVLQKKKSVEEMMKAIDEFKPPEKKQHFEVIEESRVPVETGKPTESRKPVLMKDSVETMKPIESRKQVETKLPIEAKKLMEVKKISEIKEPKESEGQEVEKGYEISKVPEEPKEYNEIKDEGPEIDQDIMEHEEPKVQEKQNECEESKVQEKLKEYEKPIVQEETREKRKNGKEAKEIEVIERDTNGLDERRDFEETKEIDVTKEKKEIKEINETKEKEGTKEFEESMITLKKGDIGTKEKAFVVSEQNEEKDFNIENDNEKDDISVKQDEYVEEVDDKLSPIGKTESIPRKLSTIEASKTEHLNHKISKARIDGTPQSDNIPDYAPMSTLVQADTEVFSNKKGQIGNKTQNQNSYTDTQQIEEKKSYSRPSRQPFMKSSDPILDIIIDTSEAEKKANKLDAVGVSKLSNRVHDDVEDEPLNLSERVFDHIWPEENLPSNMTMQSEEGRKFLFCRMATFEAYRHQVCAPLIQKFHARWRASLETMQAGIFETARAERLIRGNALANKAYSEAMQAMYDDIYLDEEGQIVSGKRVQQRLARDREGLSYSVESGPGSSQGNGEAHTKSALLGSLVDSQAALAEKFSSHGHLVTDEVVSELSNLRSYLKTQMLDFKRKGDPLMREIQDSEAEILGAFSIFELIGAIPADYDGASVHSLNASRHTLQADGSWHGTPGSICSTKDGDDGDDNSIRRGFFAKKLHSISGRTTDQSIDNNSVGASTTADTTTSIRFLSNPNSPLHAAIRANAIVRDGWLAEMLYRQAVNSQVTILKKCGAGLEEISNSMRRIEVNRQTRIHELLLDFLPRQRRLYLGLSSISAPVLNDLTSLRVEAEELERQVDDALKQHMQVLLKKDSAQRSSIMNRSRAQAPNLGDLHGVLTGEFFDNGLLRAATVFERRSGVRGYWKPTLVVVTSDQYLHMFDLSFLPEVSSGTLPESVFEMLLPDYDLPTIEGESVIERVDSLLKNLTPEITIHLIKCMSSGISSDPRSLEIVEDVKGTIMSSSTRKFVLRTQRPDETEQWLALLQSFENENTIDGESPGEPMRTENSMVRQN